MRSSGIILSAAEHHQIQTNQSGRRSLLNIYSKLDRFLKYISDHPPKTKSNNNNCGKNHENCAPNILRSECQSYKHLLLRTPSATNIIATDKKRTQISTSQTPTSQTSPARLVLSFDFIEPRQCAGGIPQYG